jgi:predicted amidohydrolase
VNRHRARSEISIAAAQIASVRGDIRANVAAHLEFVRHAVTAGVDLVVFPELSLTGYELDLARTLQLTETDAELEPFRRLARQRRIHMLVGAPLASGGEKPYLAAFLIGPESSVCYAKIHVHASETPFFAAGNRTRVVSIAGVPIGVAICADTSDPTHAASISRGAAELYAASVMKTQAEFPAHARRLRQYAIDHGMAVLTANYAGSSGGSESAGRSTIWDELGRVVAQAPSNAKALVIARRVEERWHGDVLMDLD